MGQPLNGTLTDSTPLLLVFNDVLSYFSLFVLSFIYSLFSRCSIRLLRVFICM